MLDRRTLIAAGTAGGLVLGAVLWLGLARGVSAQARLDDLQTRIGALQAPARSRWATIDGAGLSASPIFALTTGPNAVSEPTIGLQGIARTPSGASALLAINGKPADWLAVGDTRDGVTLQEVRSGGVVLDTITGQRDLALGQKLGPPQPGQANTSAPAPTAGGGAPTGYRLPPAPANAPKGK